MKKLLPIFLSVVTSLSFAAPADSTSSSHSSEHLKLVKLYNDQDIKKALQPKPFATQVGINFEERNSTYADAYLTINQLIYDRYFWELRRYYVHNYIVTAPPAKAVPLPLAKNEQNVNGDGTVGIFGVDFHVTPKVSLLPFVRLQYFTNTSNAYKDTFGNEIASYSTPIILA